MGTSNEKNKDYASLAVLKKENGENDKNYAALSNSAVKRRHEIVKDSNFGSTPYLVDTQVENPESSIGAEVKPRIFPKKKFEANDYETQNEKFENEDLADGEEIPVYARTPKQKLEFKKKKLIAETEKLLRKDRWIARNGHNVTYIGLFLFTLTVYFRPYEWIPAFSSFTSMALICALFTLVAYLPTQLSSEGNISILTTEIKCILFLAGWSLLLMPIAKNFGMAWSTFNDTFVKIVIIFIVMVNTLRTRSRLIGLMWLSIGIGVMLSYQAINLYQQGIFKTEGYRVNVDFGGMFGNPNDMAIHLVMFTPVAFVLGLVAKNYWAKLIYFVSTAMMVFANMISQSRGGFLGLMVVFCVLVWKLSKKNRIPVVLCSLIVAGAIIVVAPGNYGLRILSIFIPSYDAAGSNDQRRELLIQSIEVTLRNPWGIGLGNFPVVGIRNLETHNAYTQVSSELGIGSLIAYVTLMISPLRKLIAIEKQMFAHEDSTWMYYLAIGLQASILGYMVSSFFGPVAYNWFIYFPIGYAVCLRRIYQISQDEKSGNNRKVSDVSFHVKANEAAG